MNMVSLNDIAFVGSNLIPMTPRKCSNAKDLARNGCTRVVLGRHLIQSGTTKKKMKVIFACSADQTKNAVSDLKLT